MSMTEADHRKHKRLCACIILMILVCCLSACNKNSSSDEEKKLLDDAYNKVKAIIEGTKTDTNGSVLKSYVKTCEPYFEDRMSSLVKGKYVVAEHYANGESVYDHTYDYVYDIESDLLYDDRLYESSTDRSR